MGFHFDTVADAKRHLAAIKANSVPARIQFRIETYADGTCLLLIHDPRGVD